MASDDYIKDRLARWGEWVERRESGAGGFPRECSYTRMTPRSGEGFRSPEVDGEAFETEQAVVALPAHLRETVREMYARPGTVEQKAKRLCCNRDTVYARVEKALPLLSEWFRSSHRKKNA